MAKLRVIKGAVWGVAVMAWAGAAAAQVPRLMINYQGRLLNGTNLYNGTIALEIQLWDAATNGTLLYADSNRVEVVDGLYATLIGDDGVYGSFTNAMACSNLWIGLVVDGQPLHPRERMAAVAFAQRADGVKPGGITAGMIASGAVLSTHIATGAVGTAHLAAGAVTAEKLAVGAVTTEALALGAVDANRLALALLPEAARGVVCPAPKANGRFGTAIAALDANRVLVGAPGAGGDGRGRVFLLNPNGAVLAVVTNPTFTAGDEFGYAVAAVGPDRFVVGAPFADDALPDVGRAYLYDATGALVAVLTAAEAKAGARFGWAVAGVGSNLFVVGAPGFDAEEDDVGRAFLYDRTGSLVGELRHPAPQPGACFGEAVAAMGTNRLAVGAPGDRAHAGSVSLFTTAGECYALLDNPGGEAPDRFGAALAGLADGRLVVGAPQCSQGGATNAGAVYVFNEAGSLQYRLANPTPEAGDGFGTAVGGLGQYLLVGTPYQDAPGANDAGAVLAFNAAGVPQTVLTNPAPAAGDNFGAALAGVSDNLLAVSAPGDDNIEEDAGALYLCALQRVLAGVLAENVPEGAITAAQIASGAVGAQQLASNIVTSAHLAKDYQSGRLEVGTADVDFEAPPLQVSFAPVFTSTPIVTLALETTSRTFGAAASLFLESRSPTGFVARINLPITPPVVIASNGAQKATCLQVVAGSPAVAFDHDNGIRYARALDALGTSWSAPVSLGTPSAAGLWGLALVNTNPAVCWSWVTLSPQAGVYYQRSLDSLGNTWGPRVPVYANQPSLNSAALAVVQGRPAIACVVSNYDAVFIRANDATGGTWGAVRSIYHGPGLDEVHDIALQVVNGRPAVAFLSGWWWDGKLIYVQASNSTDTAWGPPILVDTNVLPGQATALVVVNGNPAIAYQANNTIRYIGATDPNGTSWGKPLNLAAADAGYYLSLAVVQGRPAVAYYDTGNINLKYLRAWDANGTLWPAAAVTVDTQASIFVGQGCALTEVAGEPAVSYYCDDAGPSIRFIRDASPPFTINWIAVEP